MNKQFAVAALMAITGLISEGAWAAREQLTFEVSLTIPSRPFFIIPTESDWIHRPQQLIWDPVRETLGSVRKYFDVHHDASAIEARLVGSPYMSTGRPDELIQLHVFFNNVQVPASLPAIQVVSQAEAAAGTRVLLEISPVKPLNGYKPGDYAGTVFLLFNAKAPGE